MTTSAAVAGSIKTSMLASLSARSDLTWEMYDVIIWAGTENFVVLFCGCIPPLKPLWDKWTKSDGLLASLHFSNRTRSRGTDNEVSLVKNGGAQNKAGFSSKESQKSSISLSHMSHKGRTDGYNVV
jgi:hypothetical protein